MAASEALREELTKAWTHHRDGRHSDAVEAFKAALLRNPDQVDVLYGLGLAQRAGGNAAAAADTLARCLAIVSSRNEQSPADDQMAMLKRMVEQRLAETRSRRA